MSNSLSQLTTEQVNENTKQIDELSPLEIVQSIHQEDRLICKAIEAIIPQIAQATELIITAFERGGRLFYIGAGTSGRIGVLDASECPPTFGTDPSMVQGIIAGGDKAIRDAVEGAEDSESLGADDIDFREISALDVVIGIAASGRTPYVLGAMKRASELGATVIGLCNNLNSPMKDHAVLMLEAIVGPEVILGSTRMKSGTSQKLILNMLTTTSMIRIGKVYENLMVDLNPSNEKLVYRAKRIIRLATDADDNTVNTAFEASNGHVKTAIVMILTGTNQSRAAELLSLSGGFVRKAVALVN
ncbi:N-acetylmuramic acid 6-phosphate etherase [compost metagenome]